MTPSTRFRRVGLAVVLAAVAVVLVVAGVSFVGTSQVCRIIARRNETSYWRPIFLRLFFQSSAWSESPTGKRAKSIAGNPRGLNGRPTRSYFLR